MTEGNQRVDGGAIWLILRLAMAKTEVRANSMALTARASTAGRGYWTLAWRRGSGTWVKVAAKLVTVTGQNVVGSKGVVDSMARSLGLVVGLISHHHPKERSLCHPHSRISPTDYLR